MKINTNEYFHILSLFTNDENDSITKKLTVEDVKRLKDLAELATPNDYLGVTELPGNPNRRGLWLHKILKPKS